MTNEQKEQFIDGIYDLIEKTPDEGLQAILALVAVSVMADDLDTMHSIIADYGMAMARVAEHAYQSIVSRRN